MAIAPGNNSRVPVTRMKSIADNRFTRLIAGIMKLLHRRQVCSSICGKPCQRARSSASRALVNSHHNAVRAAGIAPITVSKVTALLSDLGYAPQTFHDRRLRPSACNRAGSRRCSVRRREACLAEACVQQEGSAILASHRFGMNRAVPPHPQQFGDPACIFPACSSPSSPRAPPSRAESHCDNGPASSPMRMTDNSSFSGPVPPARWRSWPRARSLRSRQQCTRCSLPERHRFPQ